MDELCRIHEEDKLIQNLVGKPEGKRLLWTLTCRWEDDIKIFL